MLTPIQRVSIFPGITSGKDVGAALKATSMTIFDAGNWVNMIAAIEMAVYHYLVLLY